jgi:hypothetical protein
MNPQIHVLHKNKNKRYKKNLETHRGNLELREVEVRHGGQRNVEDDEEEGEAEEHGGLWIRPFIFIFTIVTLLFLYENPKIKPTKPTTQKWA